MLSACAAAPEAGSAATKSSMVDAPRGSAGSASGRVRNANESPAAETEQTFNRADSDNAPDNGMTAAEAVRYYFKQWNAKNRQGMHGMECKGLQSAEFDMEHLNSVRLIGCTEETDPSKIDFQGSWYGVQYPKAMVYVKFKVDYRGGEGAGFTNGTYEWRYYLVYEDGGWVISQYGV